MQKQKDRHVSGESSLFPKRNI